MRTRVKICGITRAEDLKLAVAAGADAIGFNFFPKSPRYLTPAAAADLIQQVPAYVCKVGLFVNAEPEAVNAYLQQTDLDLLQFHGDETEDFCLQFNKPYMKVLRVRSSADLKQLEAYPKSQGILLDAYDEKLYGGTGKVLDWQNLHQALQGLERPWVLAGGLNPGNVAEAIRLTRPYSVDVSSGVEQSPGLKDKDKMTAFFAAVEAALDDK